MGLLDATQFIADQLDGMDKARVHIAVMNMRRGSLGKAMEKGHPQGRDGWYTIQVKKDMPFLEKIVTLAHELVHVSQFVTGRLGILDTAKGVDGFIVWEGSQLDALALRRMTYKDRPWEIEAFACERDLAKAYLAWEEEA